MIDRRSFLYLCGCAVAFPALPKPRFTWKVVNYIGMNFFCAEVAKGSPGHLNIWGESCDENPVIAFSFVPTEPYGRESGPAITILPKEMGKLTKVEFVEARG